MIAHDPITHAELLRGGPPLWTSGTYQIGQVRRSPIDLHRYLRTTAGAGTLDPSSDAANWRLLPPGGAIKSVQRGVASPPNGVNAVVEMVVTIAAVNPGKSTVQLLSSNAITNMSYALNLYMSLRLISATQLGVTSSALYPAINYGSGMSCSWEVTEWN